MNERGRTLEKKFKVVETDGIIFWGKKEEPEYILEQEALLHAIVLFS